MNKQNIIAAAAIAGTFTFLFAGIAGVKAYQNYQANQTCAKVEAKVDEALKNGQDSIRVAGDALAEMKAAAAVLDYSTFYQAQRTVEEANRKTKHYGSLIREARKEYDLTCTIDARREAYAEKRAATFVY